MSFELQQVVKKVGTEIRIYETDLRLEPGSLNVLLGPKQVGKTTLMRLMAGLDRPSAGRLLLDGLGLRSPPEPRDH